MIGGQREHYDSFIEAFSDFLKVFLKVKVPVKDFLNSVPVNGPKDFNTQNYEVTTKHTHTQTYNSRDEKVQGVLLLEE